MLARVELDGGRHQRGVGQADPDPPGAGTELSGGRVKVADRDLGRQHSDRSCPLRPCRRGCRDGRRSVLWRFCHLCHETGRPHDAASVGHRRHLRLTEAEQAVVDAVCEPEDPALLAECADRSADHRGPINRKCTDDIDCRPVGEHLQEQFPRVVRDRRVVQLGPHGEHPVDHQDDPRTVGMVTVVVTDSSLHLG